ncbi:hypothetical protein D3C75_1267330 [compost metagenome]
MKERKHPTKQDGFVFLQAGQNDAYQLAKLALFGGGVPLGDIIAGTVVFQQHLLTEPMSEKHRQIDVDER